MIAKVLVTRKSKSSIFDYDIPDGFSLERFSLVEVPFSSSRVYGLVLEIKNSSRFKLKPIKRVLSGPIITEKQFKLAQIIAEDQLVSLASAIHPFILRAPLKNLKGLSADKAVRTESRFAVEFLMVNSSQRVLHFVQRIAEESQSMFICAEITRAERNFERLKKLLPNKDVLFYHSQLKPAEKSRIFSRVLSGQDCIIVGTRAAIFLPYTRLKLALVEDPTNYGYQDDQSPYLNGFLATLKLAKVYKVHLIIASLLPDMVTFPMILKGAAKLISHESNCNVFFEPTWKKLAQSVKLQEVVTRAIEQNQKVLVIGPFKHLVRYVCQSCESPVVCTKCGKQIFDENTLGCASCSTPLDLICHNCQSANLRKVGFSVKQIRADLSAAFGPRSHKITVVHLQDIDELDPVFDIILVPYFEEIASFPYLDSKERLFRAISEFQSSQIYLFGEELAENKLANQIKKSDWKSFLTDELIARRKNGLPPYKKAMILVTKAPHQEKNLEQFLDKTGLTGQKIYNDSTKTKTLILIDYEDFNKRKTQFYEAIDGKSHLEIDPLGWIF